MRFPYQNKKKLILSSLLLFSTSSWANANTPCGYKVTADCLPFNQWFVGGQVGESKTDISNSEINNAFNNNILTRDSISFDDDDTAYELFLGYRFNSYIALQGGYQNLGDRKLNYKGSEANINHFYQAAEQIHLDSGEGLKISVIGSWPINEHWSVSGKLGLFDWKQEQQYKGSGLKKYDIDGTDVTYGLELGYHFRRDFQLYAGLESVKLDNNRVNNVGLGIRYFFTDKPKPMPIATKKVTPLPVVAKPRDSDKDGIFNAKDKCANTPITHRVDNHGCTLYADKIESINLYLTFPHNSAIVPSDEYGDIKAVADFMKKYPQSTVVLEGHTSATGAAAYNRTLSQRRANAVKALLNKKYNVPIKRIKAVGYGATHLLDTSRTPAANTKNRRVTAKIDVKQKEVVYK